MPTLQINGNEETYADADFPATAADLLERHQLDETLVIMEVDGAIVPRGAAGSFPLRDRQTVELVRLVGGG